MKKSIVKEFEGITWYECVSKVVKFIIDYNLEFINMEMKKGKTNYVAVLEYGLGVRNG